MAGQQPIEDGRKRPYVPAIPMIRHCAILIEIAGTSPAMTPRVLLLLHISQTKSSQKIELGRPWEDKRLQDEMAEDVERKFIDELNPSKRERGEAALIPPLSCSASLDPTLKYLGRPRGTYCRLPAPESRGCPGDVRRGGATVSAACGC
jgi:hypothetical protein